MGVGLSWYSIW